MGRVKKCRLDNTAKKELLFNALGLLKNEKAVDTLHKDVITQCAVQKRRRQETERG